ncbi:hypothetical protein C2857_003141 [Epichloe festucae Fl1]|uniref:AAA+ ATPase domain-containing protein n=1 Tax=Epichloe festucae (strain Fl1) TaxID=877507 RepID=A0A7S9KK70_EPIFF|nr:hypothetical protein C2857_003141 [Epichloe festucae Fl1]
MLRNKVFTALQKTYDDSYLSCSTAVYYESQGDETEATRHWKHALEQIYEHRANKATPGYGPQTDTEKALVEALKQLELQCKERIDLLEALRVSRKEDSAHKTAANTSKGPMHEVKSQDDRPKGSIGQGTIPAVTYSELSRPAAPPRPPLPLRASSVQTTLPSPSGSNHILEFNPTAKAKSRSQSPNQPPRSEKTLRSTSPEKHMMRTTLRTSKHSEKSAWPTRKLPKPAAEGPSKAATLAWSASGPRDRALKVTPSNGSAPPPQLTSRQTSEKLRSVPSPIQWDSHSRRLVTSRETEFCITESQPHALTRQSDDYSLHKSSHLSVSAASSALNSSSSQDTNPVDQPSSRSGSVYPARNVNAGPASRMARDERLSNFTPADDSANLTEKKNLSDGLIRRKGVAARSNQQHQSLSKISTTGKGGDDDIRRGRQKLSPRKRHSGETEEVACRTTSRPHLKRTEMPETKPGIRSRSSSQTSDEGSPDAKSADPTWRNTKASILKNLPLGVDEGAAKQILNDIVVQGDEVHWSDIAGLEIAKNALRENVVYPFLRPDLFMGLREPARGMLLFGPPGTASSLTSKYLGESEKLVRALFGLAKSLAPSIIFVDEIDSLLSQRSGSGEHEATRRIKTEFLIQWSDLQRAAAGRETTDKDKERGDANRVLVLAATNIPWAIDEAARRRFVRRQYIPLPEPHTRETQLRTLLGQQKHGLSASDIEKLVGLTDGFSGSDITALAKDAAMGPLRSLGEALLHMTMDDIRPILLLDFEASLGTIRPSVGKAGLKEYEDWAREFGERGG